ncbi:MAG TPA: ParA family protein [Hyphomicrobiaceae bacterium]|jgi:chromosome partitioning protein
MRIWSFVQQKGGSGKSTICTNVAVCGEEHDEMVLIVDLDPQLSGTLWRLERGTNKPLVLDGKPDKLTQIIESASTLGVTLCLIDSPSKLDDIAIAAIRAADMIICPTLPDLFNLGSLQDTVRLLELAEKLGVSVGVINNIDKAGEEARIGEATAVMEKFNMAVCPAVIHHRPEFQIAAERGKAVTEIGAKGRTAAEEIRKLWGFLDGRAKSVATDAKLKRKLKDTKR